MLLETETANSMVVVGRSLQCANAGQGQLSEREKETLA